MRSSREWGLQSFRNGALGIVRLLLLALSLQIAIPVVDGLAAVSLDRVDAFTADLSNSLCHDGSANEGGAPAGNAPVQSRHCLFCLPLAGDHATQTVEFAVPAPKVVAVAAIAVGDQREAVSPPYVLAHSRAPPREAAA
ncbi:MAG: hypothetical protein EPN20_17420 [Magnetospirillum sp.]|nr:MAG: hypothetical protein EPN20_17420 [Magnetospirillum sp.]